MKGGVGGPLLCIGDLLADLAEKEDGASGGGIASDQQHAQKQTFSSSSSSSSSPPSSSLESGSDALQSSVDLTHLFHENYGQLNEALAGTDHSWTALTLKLCSAVDTANKLVQSTNSNVKLLSEKVGELEQIVKRGDSAVAAAKSLPPLPKSKGSNA